MSQEVAQPDLCSHEKKYSNDSKYIPEESQSEKFVRVISPYVLASRPLEDKYRKVAEHLRTYISCDEAPDYFIMCKLAEGTVEMGAVTKETVLSAVLRQGNRKGIGWWRSYYTNEFEKRDYKRVNQYLRAKQGF